MGLVAEWHALLFDYESILELIERVMTWQRRLPDHGQSAFIRFDDDRVQLAAMMDRTPAKPSAKAKTDARETKTQQPGRRQILEDDVFATAEEAVHLLIDRCAAEVRVLKVRGHEWLS